MWLYHLLIDFYFKEEQRWQILQRHTVQREKLRIAFEQEILRTYANAKRLEENQAKPYSACMILQAEFENQYELQAGDLPPSTNADGENSKRFGPFVRNVTLLLSHK